MNSTAPRAQQALKLTQGYCVVYQTLRNSPEIETEVVRALRSEG